MVLVAEFNELFNFGSTDVVLVTGFAKIALTVGEELEAGDDDCCLLLNSTSLALFCGLGVERNKDLLKFGSISSTWTDSQNETRRLFGVLLSSANKAELEMFIIFLDTEWEVLDSTNRFFKILVVGVPFDFWIRAAVDGDVFRLIARILDWLANGVDGPLSSTMSSSLDLTIGSILLILGVSLYRSSLLKFITIDGFFNIESDLTLSIPSVPEQFYALSQLCL